MLTRGLWSLDEAEFKGSHERAEADGLPSEYPQAKHLLRAVALDQRMTEASLKLLLIDLFQFDGLSALPEVRHDPWNEDATTSNRRIDLLGIEWAPSHERRMVAVEIKSSRQDFLSDVRDPDKQ